MRFAFATRLPGTHVFFAGNTIHFVFLDGGQSRLVFPGANPKASWRPIGDVVATTSYRVGKDSRKWVEQAPQYSRIRLEGLYPGVDLEFYGLTESKQLEYDLILSPNADPKPIRVCWENSGKAISGAVRQKAPELYQLSSSGHRLKVSGQFVPDIEAGTMQLKIGKYDASRPLIVDPVIETLSYVGGEGDDEIVYADSRVIVGNTNSWLLPGMPAGARRNRDIFLRQAHTTADAGTALRPISLVLGGEGDDEVAVARLYYDEFSDNFSVLLGGKTTSRDLTTVAGQGYRGGESDGFFVHVGTGNISSGVPHQFHYLGGSGADIVTDATWPSGSTYMVIGNTTSGDLSPLPVTSDRTFSQLNRGTQAPAGTRDGFMVMISPSAGSGQPIPQLYLYVGGSGDDELSEMALTRGVPSETFIPQELILVGTTASSDFPGTSESGLQLQGNQDGVLVRMPMASSPIIRSNLPYPTPSEVLQATWPLPSQPTLRSWLIGGEGQDKILGSACFGGSLGCMFLGTTTSAQLPIRNASQATYGGEQDLFVGRWSLELNDFAWLTYWGGKGREEAAKIVGNVWGNVFVSGNTNSADFPLVAPTQNTLGGGRDGVLAIFDPLGVPTQSTYIGGSGEDWLRGVSVQRPDIARVFGGSRSTDMPVRLAVQPRPGGGVDGFVADIAREELLAPLEISLPQYGRYFLEPQASTQTQGAFQLRCGEPEKLRLGASPGNMADGVRFTGSLLMEGMVAEGETSCLLSSEGFAPKRILVRFTPGVLRIRNLQTKVAAWSSAIRLEVGISSPGSQTILPITDSLGWASPTFSVSDSQVLAIVAGPGLDPQLKPREPGSAAVTASLGPLQSSPETVEVLPNEITFPSQLQLARNAVSLLGFRIFQEFRSLAPSHWIRARSENPDLVRIAIGTDRNDGDLPEKYSDSAVLRTSQQFGFQLLGLAGSGETRIVLTSSAFAGEKFVRVVIRPLWVRPRLSQTGVFRLLRVGVEQKAQLGFDLFAGDPGAEADSTQVSLLASSEPMIVNWTNSDPSVVELPQLRQDLRLRLPEVELRLIKAGLATLRFSAPSGVQVTPAEIAIEIAGPNPEDLPKEVVVGKGMRAAVRFPWLGASVKASIADPNVALVQLGNLSAPLAAQEFGPAQVSNFGESLYVQCLPEASSVAARSTALRLDFGDRPFTIPVRCVPAGLGFLPSPTRSPNGFAGARTVVAYALDPTTLVSLQEQQLAWGAVLPYRLLADGVPVGTNPGSTVLTYDRPTQSIQLATPSGASRFTLEQPPGFLTPATYGRAEAEPEAFGLQLVLANGAIAIHQAKVSNMITSSDGQPIGVPIRLRSLHPDRLLLAAGPDAIGVATLDVNPDQPNFYMQALQAGGSASLRAEFPGASKEWKVELSALDFVLLSPLNNNGVSLGASGSVTAFGVFATAREANALRRADVIFAPPLRARLRSSNPAVLAVETGSSTTNSRTAPLTFSVRGLSEGFADLVMEIEGDDRTFGRSNLRIQPPTSAVATSQADLDTVLVGRNMEKTFNLNFRTPPQRPGTLRIVSNDPARILVSAQRNATGAAFATIPYAAGAQSVGPVIVQGLSSLGPTTLTVSQDGEKVLDLPARVTRSWLTIVDTANGQPVKELSLSSASATLAVVAMQEDWRAPNQFALQNAGPAESIGQVRARIEPFEITLRVDKPALLREPPGKVRLFANESARFSLYPAASGLLNFTLDAGGDFGEAPEGLGPRPILIRADQTSPQLSVRCSSGLAQDMVGQCSVQGVTSFSVRSLNPDLVLVSAASNQPGAPQLESNLNSGTFSVHAVGSRGTAEIVVSSPGQPDTFASIFLVPLKFDLFQFRSDTNLYRTFRVGESISLATPTNLAGFGVSMRPGVTVRLHVEATPEGLVSFSPNTMEVDGVQGGNSIRMRMLAPGLVKVRVTSSTHPDAISDPIFLQIEP